MPERFAQDAPAPGFTIDLAGMGDSMWRSFMSHLD
jgi:hypothetical protein